ncbi:WXG100 family type VII secretion target [Hamadaea tsunoensis]|uniref:WXG100 family type VII secretion target n=1 Tax=Hamadaea tsunoensis TaxID=53368 RepID=UPI0004070373|nr:WXG100 family type VII secretion target [Hamadaea tsunoensis]
MPRSEPGVERIAEWLSPAGAALHVIQPIVEFLADPLDAVTGDPAALRDKAQAWRKAADEVHDLVGVEVGARAKLMASWEGPASEAFNRELDQLATSLEQIVGHFQQTADLLEQTATGAEQAEELVVRIIKELVAWLIATILVALASSWATLGASVAAGTSAGWSASAAAASRCATIAAKLAGLLRAAEAFLRKMSDFAQAYPLTKIKAMGIGKWARSSLATGEGYQAIASNWVIKAAVDRPALL